MRTVSTLLCLTGLAFCFVSAAARYETVSDSQCRQITGGAPPQKCYLAGTEDCPAKDACPTYAPCPAEGFYVDWANLSKVTEEFFGPNRWEKKAVHDPDDLAKMLIGRDFCCYEVFSCNKTLASTFYVCEKSVVELRSFYCNKHEAVDRDSKECPDTPRSAT